MNKYIKIILVLISCAFASPLCSFGQNDQLTPYEQKVVEIHLKYLPKVFFQKNASQLNSEEAFVIRSMFETTDVSKLEGSFYLGLLALYQKNSNAAEQIKANYEKEMKAAEKLKNKIDYEREQLRDQLKAYEQRQEKLKGTDYGMIIYELKNSLSQWNLQGEFEKKEDWKNRLLLQSENKFKNLCNAIVSNQIQTLVSNCFYELGDYHADGEYFTFQSHWGKLLLRIPLSEAEMFKSKFKFDYDDIGGYLFNNCFYVTQKPYNFQIVNYTIFPKEIIFYNLEIRDLHAEGDVIYSYRNAHEILDKLVSALNSVVHLRPKQAIPCGVQANFDSKVEDLIIYFDDLGLDNPNLKGSFYNYTKQVFTPNPEIAKLRAKEEAQKQALQKANDTLQQAIDDYNSLLKQYPYNYEERKISFSLPSNLSDKVSLHDTLHSLLTTIQEQKKLLIEQFSNDSVQYQQLNKNLQAKITEANTELLKYPYNIQQRTIKDSLSIRLFGKINELSKELETKTENLEEAITQIQQEVYADLKKNNPQRLVEIYYVQNPEQKKTSDNQYLECRCKYNNRLDFDLAFIDNKLPTCDCRETKYQETKHLYHSRDEFDESYNQSESVFNQEVADRESMWKDLNELKRILDSESSLNMKKALSSSKSEITDVLNRVAWQHDSYYYEEAVELIFIYDEKLQKEWSKNGSYFNSKAEMYESWIGDDYANVLKKKKKE